MATGERPTTRIPIEREIHNTGRATLFLIDGDEVWIPNSQIEEVWTDEVEVTEWWAEKNGWM